MKISIASAAAIFSLAVLSSADAQAQVGSYYPTAPIVSYYAPVSPSASVAPVTTYYAPVPAVAAAPRTTYYAPRTTYYPPTVPVAPVASYYAPIRPGFLGWRWRRAAYWNSVAAPVVQPLPAIRP